MHLHEGIHSFRVFACRAFFLLIARRWWDSKLWIKCQCLRNETTTGETLKDAIMHAYLSWFSHVNSHTEFSTASTEGTDMHWYMSHAPRNSSSFFFSLLPLSWQRIIACIEIFSFQLLSCCKFLLNFLLVNFLKIPDFSQTALGSDQCTP